MCLKPGGIVVNESIISEDKPCFRCPSAKKVRCLANLRHQVSLLDCIVTDVETWLKHVNCEIKLQSMK